MEHDSTVTHPPWQALLTSQQMKEHTSSKAQSIAHEQRYIFPNECAQSTYEPIVSIAFQNDIFTMPFFKMAFSMRCWKLATSSDKVHDNGYHI